MKAYFAKISNDHYHISPLESNYDNIKSIEIDVSPELWAYISRSYVCYAPNEKDYGAESAIKETIQIRNKKIIDECNHIYRSILLLS